MQIWLLAADGIADGSLGISFDVLRAAARIQDAGLASARPRLGFDVRVVAAGGRPVTTAAGRRCAVDGGLPRRPALGPRDVVVIPGLGLAAPEAIAAAFASGAFAPVLDFLPRAAATGALIAASCSGTFVLAESGLLDGCQATTTWWLAPTFRARYPAVEVTPERTVVASGRRLTAGSSFAHADLMLALVARAGGPTLAELCARYLLLGTRPSQARYMMLEHLRGSDPVLRKLEQFVLRNLARPLTLADLARAAATSPRTLARIVERVLGRSPMRFLQRVRAEQAAHLLETTSTPFEAIAAEVGYAEPGALRRILRRELGATPRDLRARA